MTGALPADARARHSAEYRVRFDEATPEGTARTAVLLRYVQDVAWRHSEVRGFGRDWYAERGLFWLVRALELEIHAPARTGEIVLASTALVGFRKVLARRGSTVARPDGTLVARALIDWALIDLAGRPTRVPPEFATFFGGAPAGFEALRIDRASAPDDAVRRPIQVRPHEVDPMGHANNATYVDWLEELVGLAGGGDAIAAYPRRYQLEYVAPAAPGRDLEESTWRTSRGWAYRLADGANSILVRASLEFGDGTDP